MKKIILFLLIGWTAALTVVWGDYFYRFSRDETEKSLLAYLLFQGDYLFNLVNKENTLGFYAPADLVELSSLGAPGQSIRRPAYEALVALMRDARKEGATLKILSAYRSFERQKSLFNFYKKRYRNVESFSAEAGHSEHQLGATVDFGVGKGKIDFTAAFAKTPQGIWLEGNAWRYGFLMSYPAGKEETTGYIFEPWHWRFVGEEAAKECHGANLTLQECLASKPQFYQQEE